MTAEDVAAQLARERALRQADKMETIGRLTGAIAQQFNELLTAILTRTAALAQSLPPNRDLDELKVTAQRGAELVQRLLGFSRHHVLRSEEHTSELQSHHDLVCRLLLEKKKKKR